MHYQMTIGSGRLQQLDQNALQLQIIIDRPLIQLTEVRHYVVTRAKCRCESVDFLLG